MIGISPKALECRDMSEGTPSPLVRSGLAELAAGALTGWVYTLARTRPDLAERIGLKSTPRVRQWHLDLAMLGTATIACGLAVPDPPKVAATALGVGAWTNAMAFLPLAIKPNIERHPVYIACTVGSFVATTTGFCGMALAAWRRKPA
jgi:hypothetical protein